MARIFISNSLNSLFLYSALGSFAGDEMRDIYRPFVTSDDPDRDLRCQDAMQFAFKDLLDAAATAGWGEREAIEAIIDLAEDRLRTFGANDDAQSLLNVLMKMA